MRTVIKRTAIRHTAIKHRIITGLSGRVIGAIGAISVILFGLFALVPAAEAIAPSLATPEPALTERQSDSPATLFEQNCAGCHVNGGNVIRRGKNLKKRAMERYGYGEVGAIAQIITNGKGITSAYGDRLSSEEIGAIAQYVHEQSESGW
ncbi:MAG: c-type cytochrome [Phormidesmis sp.]